jgi:hypothetical protein
MKNDPAVMADRLIEQADAIDTKDGTALRMKLYELAAEYGKVDALNQLVEMIKEILEKVKKQA